MQNGAEFNDATSYQSVALARTESVPSIETQGDAKIIQFYVMYCIYEASNGVRNQIIDMDPQFDQFGDDIPGWRNNLGWSANGGDPCGFFGVTCDGQGRILTIDLNNNVLTGSWAPEVSLLALDGERATGAGNLNRIDLFQNQFLFNNFDNSWMQFLGSNMGKCWHWLSRQDEIFILFSVF